MSAKTNEFGVVWVGPMPKLEVYFILKNLPAGGVLYFRGAEGSVDKKINRKFVERSSFGKFLECVYINDLSNPQYIGLDLSTEEEVDIELLLEKVDLAVCLYLEKNTPRSFR